MKKLNAFSIALTFLAVTACQNDIPEQPSAKFLDCVQPAFLEKGDRVALVSPSYYTPMENIESTAEVLRRWGWEPVIGPNADKMDAGKLGGTVEERTSDLRWALTDPTIKAILCNRGGYGTIQLVGQLLPSELKENPKWLIGFSDIVTLHEMEQSVGVMSLHATMSSFLQAGGRDTSSTLMRDLLMGKVPCYELPAHPQNRIGKAEGVLVGGNLMTLAPLVGSPVDVTAYEDIILFVEEIGESMHNIDRQFNMLALSGALARCRGIVLGEFKGCGTELAYESIEAMLQSYFLPLGIPVMCGFPAGHEDVNLPLVLGAPVTLDVRQDGATLRFNILGEQTNIRIDGITATKTAQEVRMRKAGKISN